MTFFFFDGEMETDKIFPLLKDISLRANGDNTIYFSTEGGDPDLGYIIANTLYKLAIDDEKDFHIIFYGNVHSSAFFILLHLQRFKEKRSKNGLRSESHGVKWSFMDDCYGTMHSITTNFGLESDVKNKETKDDEEMDREIIDYLNKGLLKVLGKKLTKIEVRKYLKGEDIVFSAERLQKTFGGEIINQFG